jgi:hypothetical protein
MRTLVDIPEEDLAILNELSKIEKVSRSELVRRAIATYVQPHRKSAPLVGFGLWKDFPEDGLEYQERVRAEWE